MTEYTCERLPIIGIDGIIMVAYAFLVGIFQG
jgi:hypothetical protein